MSTDGALRRLQGLTLTPQLSCSTRIDQIVAALQSHDNPGVCALSKSITSAWSTQLVAERQRLALRSNGSPGPSARPCRPVARRVWVPIVRTRACEGLSVFSKAVG